MKKIVSILLVLCILFCCAAYAAAPALDLSIINSSENFYYDESKTYWTYYQYADKRFDDGSLVRILAAEWGNNTEILYYPVLYVSSCDFYNNAILYTSASFIINGNVFDLTLYQEETAPDTRSYFTLTSEAIQLMQALRNADDVSIIFRSGSNSIIVQYTYDEILPIIRFIEDIYELDYLSHITGSELAKESHYNKKTPIISCITNEVALYPKSEASTSNAPGGNASLSVGGSNEIVLSEVGISLQIPQGYITITRDASAYDSYLADWGYTKSSFTEAMVNQSSYLDAISPEYDTEIVVTMVENQLISTFRELSDVTLRTMVSSYTSFYENIGITVESYSVYKNTQTKFVKLYLSQEGANSIQFYTVYDGKAINITLHNLTGSISEENEKTIESIVDSVVFLATSVSDTNEISTSDGFEYIDETSRAKFTIPSTWEETPLSTEREFIDVKFEAVNDPGVSITFGCTDFWSTLPVAQKLIYPRSSIGNNMLTLDVLVDSFGASSDDIKKEYYGNNEFFVFPVTQTRSLYGLDFQIESVAAVLMDNGYWYQFMFSGNENDDSYKDFITIISSFTLPT